MDDREGIEWLGHPNWSICSLLGPFCSYIFQFVWTLYWEANSYYPRGLIVRKGKLSNHRNGWQRGDWVVGVFKLEHLQPFRPVLFLHFSICMNFILGGQFLLPQRANSEQGEFCKFQKWMRQGVFSAWGLQTGPFAALWAHFVLKCFQLFHFHTGEPILSYKIFNFSTFILGD